uniref:Uncharacterized protein n=1 Tax=Trichogramma kaykai TaxID=54128 RepID=A0ABD2WNV4_9HYME
MESRQHHSDKEDEGVSFEKSKLLSSTRTTESEENNSQIREINETLQTLLNKSNDGVVGNKIFVKRNYSLSPKTQIDLWLDLLKSELRTHNLVEFIEKNDFPNLSSEEIKNNKQLVRDIITNRLEPLYHKRVLNIVEPIELIEKLKEMKRIESNITATSIRERLYCLRRSSKETAIEFIDRFETLINEYDKGHKERMSDEEKASIFHHTLGETCPELNSACLVASRTGAEMTYEEMKNSLLQIEASKNKRNEKTPKVNAASVPPIDKIVCYRCTKVGHYASSCPLVPQNLWFCYSCNEVRRHNFKNCPNQCQEYVSNNSNSNNKNNIKSKFMRGAGRGRGRSSFRGKRFTPYSKRPKAQRAGESNKIHGNDTDNLIFIADSGATEHIVKEREILENFVEKNLGEIKSANKNKSANIKINGIGNLTFYSENNKEIILWNILAAEGIADNLLSLRKFADAGFGIFLDNKELRIFNKKTGEIHIRGVYREPNWIVTIDLSDSSESNTKRYDFSTRLVDTEYIQASEDPQSSELGREDFGNTESDISLKRKITDLNTEIPDEEIKNLSWNFPKPPKRDPDSVGMLWHRRLGHTSRDYLIKLQKECDLLSKAKFGKEISDCDICIRAKMEKLPFKNNRTRSDRPLHTIHADTMGPIKPSSFPGSNRYVIVLIDDFSRYARVYSISNKTESGDCLEEFLKHTRNLRGKNEKVCYLTTDNGTKFTGGKFA